MDLDRMIDDAAAAIPRGRRGRALTPPTFLREIVPEEVPALLAAPAPPMAARPMQKLRHTHHLAARLLAEGRNPVEVAAITGYTSARVNQLKADPTFQELLQYYRDNVQEKYLSVHERLAALGVAITEEIQDRLDQNPDGFTNEELRKLAESVLDRGGHGPTATRNVNVQGRNLTMHLVEQIKMEAGEAQNVRLLAAE